MKQRLDDMYHECLVCKVPNECKPGHDLCGISRGMKYEIYPPTSHSHAKVGVPFEIYNQKSCGGAVKPVYELGDGMEQLYKEVAAYKEPWMQKRGFGDIDL